jgi:hypothetical protein
VNEPKPMPDNKSEDRGQNVDDGPKPSDSTPAKALTPEEQMEAYERDLKEKDWGHQPC